jgi:hypothetical protein
MIDSLALGEATIQISGRLPAHASPAQASISQIAHINLVFFRIAIIFYTTTCEKVKKRGVRKRAGSLEEEGVRGVRKKRRGSSKRW